MKKTTKEKFLLYVNKYKDEFTIFKNEQLYCNLCSMVVDSSKKFVVEMHRKSKKHDRCYKNMLAEVKPFKTQQFLQNRDIVFEKHLLNAFLSTNTPLFRLNDPKFHSLFRYLGRTLPSVFYAY